MKARAWAEYRKSYLASPPAEMRACIAGTDERARFVGGKGGNGVWQRIISEMPAHTGYVELFAGRGTILLAKRPAAWSIAVDNDADTCADLRDRIAKAVGMNGAVVICGDARSYLAKLAGNGRETLVYADPPYLMATRSTQRAYYRQEFATETEHMQLLNLLRLLTCNVMLSGYESSLYSTMLQDWRQVKIPTSTRGGPAVECLWCNFPPAAELHDCRFAGSNFRDRERIRRRIKRWTAKLTAMPALDRQALIAGLDEWRRQSK